MLTKEYEKAILGLILRNPESDLPKRIVAELFDDRFESDAHKRIYRVIINLIYEKIEPNLINVARKLGDNLEDCGGLEYLQSLIVFVEALRVHSQTDVGPWIRMVDNAGRLRHLSMVVNEYQKIFSDFETLVKQVEDVDTFLRDFMEKVNKGASKVKSTYKPIGQAVDEALRLINLSADGFNTDIIPCGLPSIQKYQIPRPSSLGIIAGISSAGKTQFGLHLCLGVAMWLHQNQLPGVVTINSLETTGPRLALRMATVLSKVDNTRISQGTLSAKEQHRLIEKIKYIKSLPIEYDDNPNVTSEEVIWQAIGQHIQKKRVLGLSDYAELFADQHKTSEELRVSNIIKNIRTVAWETGSCEIMVSQFNNAVMRSGTKIGGLAHTRYSGAIGQAADWFLEVWNPIAMHNLKIPFNTPKGKTDDRAYILIEKNKEYSPGEATFNWVPEHRRFKDMSLGIGQTFDIPMVEQEQF